MLTWEQFLHAPIRTLPRRALVVPIGASLLVHGALLCTLIYLSWTPLRPARLTDSPPETVLTLAPTPPAPTVVQPAPLPPPPPPEPQPEPKPEPAAAAPDELAAPAPKLEPQPEPLPPVVVHVPPAAPDEPTPAPPPAPVAAAPTPVSFAGVEAPRARRIVYAVDASGAMTSSLKFVKEELARSISRLDASQSFQVIVFRELPGDDQGSVEMVPASPGELMPVTGETRISSAAWLANVQPGGRSDPLVGLTAALKLKPDLVFLVTRSIRRSGATTEWGAGSVATLEALDKLNPVGRNGLRPTVIKTIQFLDEDPTGLLEQIAATHGDGDGSYKVLKLQDLK